MKKSKKIPEMDLMELNNSIRKKIGDPYQISNIYINDDIANITFFDYHKAMCLENQKKVGKLVKERFPNIKEVHYFGKKIE